ncbi:hypothetical protein [Streptomyces hainanensis]|uniref:Sensor domain-containing protein n=1 Tax=Streptomyces hainanensis TaxID=402648 RepID=A0A4R4T0B2_9ACTN|nr:hypothetical protein [Streptomyces hainanensis]TDC70140.1 hypothetical protein E1283_25115 [Streptomyces hainanensis]
MTLRPGLARTACAAAISVAALAGTLAFGGGTATAHVSHDGPATQSAQATQAAPSPLEPGDLPPHSTPWTAGPLTRGAGDPLFCVENAVPERGTVRRDFHTDLETNATQLIIDRNSPAAARRTVATLRASIENCADGWAGQYPGASAEWVDHGPIAAGDGGRVYGVGTSMPELTDDVHLFAVGRSGDLVTVVVWGEMGTLASAPTDAFRATARTAVDRLGG